MRQMALWLGMAALAGLAGCSDGGDPANEGTVELSITNAPSDVSCLRVTIDGTRSLTKLYELTPGAPTTYRITRLPVGRATFDAQAYATACARLPTPPGDPLFVAEAPVSVRIDPVDVAHVVLKLIRNGQADVGIDFETGNSPYLVGSRPGVVFKDLITAGESVGGYRMAGIPDGLGYDGRLFTNGEESGPEGRAFAHLLDGSSYELPRLGKMSVENVVANPGTGPRTLVAALDDSTGGQVYFYAGQKSAAGTPVERAGLSNGKLLGLAVTGFAAEDLATGIPSGTPFTLADLGNVAGQTGAQLDDASRAAAVTGFNRPEDGAWDPRHPNDFYFVTTASVTGPSRLWRLRFADLANPANGGTIDQLLDGSEGHKMLDNITVDRNGHIYLLEDVGNNVRLGKVWRYDLANDTLTEVAQHDPLRFAPGAPQFLTQDEESSGIIDAASILGPGWFLLDVQAHYATDAETVEGGQLLALYDPSWADPGLAKVDLAVIGDTPYGAAQIADFPNLVAAINGAPDVARVVHLGDIKNGSSSCDDAYFAQVFAGFGGFADALIYTPGDNEWTDCHRANNGAYDPLERLDAVRRQFFPLPGRTLGAVRKDVLTQSSLPAFSTFVENTMWAEAGVTFATLHVVGSNNSLLPWYSEDKTGTKVDDPLRRLGEELGREAADLDWLERTFAFARRSGAKGVALFMQADMWDPAIFGANQYDGFTATVRRLADLTRAFGKPVLLLEGDSHVFKVDNPLASGDARYGVSAPVPNLTRIVVQGSTTAPLTEWLRLKVDPTSAAVFSWTRNPR
jgi:hypothetical protein